MMNVNIRQLEIDLDNAWWSYDKEKYQEKLDTTKMMGFKVYRNDKGRHKVVKNPDGGDFMDFFNGILNGKH